MFGTNLLTLELGRQLKHVVLYSSAVLMSCRGQLSKVQTEEA